MNNQSENTNFVTKEIKTSSDNLSDNLGSEEEFSLSISNLSKETSYSVLDTIYRDEWVIRSVFSILWQKKIDPAKLVDDLSLWREEFKKKLMSNLKF